MQAEKRQSHSRSRYTRNLSTHWWPITFIVIFDDTEESRLYRILNEGRATATSTTAGSKVQAASKSCPSIKDRLKDCLWVSLTINTPTPVIIKINTIIK